MTLLDIETPFLMEEHLFTPRETAIAMRIGPQWRKAFVIQINCPFSSLNFLLNPYISFTKVQTKFRRISQSAYLKAIYHTIHKMASNQGSVGFVGDTPEFLNFLK